MVFLLQAAYHYLDIGLSVIGVDADKQPVWRWRRFQFRKPNRWELRRMFSHPAATGLAIICGAVSGGIEVIDFDLKYDLSGRLFENYCQKIQQNAPKLFSQLVFARSRSGGYHILYRTAKPNGYAQLAARPASQDEKNEDPSRTSRVLVEVISEKGYIVASPTPGYLLVQGDLADLPLITEEQRTFLWDVARSFDQLPEVPRAASPVLTPAHGTGSPFDDYNERGDIVDLLQSHGWKVVGQDAMKTYFLRPGDPQSKTSGDFHHRLRLFTLFTPNSPPFKRLVGYRPATVFAMLECAGDFKLAARRLLEMGYGVPYSQQKQNPTPMPGPNRRRRPPPANNFFTS